MSFYSLANPKADGEFVFRNGQKNANTFHAIQKTDIIA